MVVQTHNNILPPTPLILLCVTKMPIFSCSSPLTRNRAASADPRRPAMDSKLQAASSLVAKLSSVSETTRGEALRELRLMSKHDAESRPIIAESGAVPFLAETLYSSSHESQENAAATLLNLSISGSARDALVETRGLLDAVSHSLSHHHSSSSQSAVQSCAATLHSLLVSLHAFRSAVGSKRDIIYALIDIIRSPTSATRSIKDSLKALFAISLHQPNRAALVELGAVGTLFSLVLKDGRVGIVEDATAVIAQVAGCQESGEAFRRVSGVEVLVDLLDPSTGSSGRVKENAVAALLNLASCGTDAGVREMGMEAAEGIAHVAQNGTTKGKSKAVALMKLLDDGAGRGNVFTDSTRFDSIPNQTSS